jgi:glucose-1-phosphate adenylyltransferase
MPYIASMGIYVFSKDVMLKLLHDQFREANDFGSEVIPGATDIGMRVCGVHRIFSCLFSSVH